MEVPNMGEIVWYVLPSGRFTPAIVVRADSLDSVSLTVFGDTQDGPEFACGCVSRARVQHWEPRQEDEYPIVGTWFRPVGQFALRYPTP